jgi:hypothetical protein
VEIGGPWLLVRGTEITAHGKRGPTLLDGVEQPLNDVQLIVT